MYCLCRLRLVYSYYYVAHCMIYLVWLERTLYAVASFVPCNILELICILSISHSLLETTHNQAFLTHTPSYHTHTHPYSPSPILNGSGFSHSDVFWPSWSQPHPQAGFKFNGSLQDIREYTRYHKTKMAQLTVLCKITNKMPVCAMFSLTWTYWYLSSLTRSEFLSKGTNWGDRDRTVRGSGLGGWTP